jgi:hypothetical protein
MALKTRRNPQLKAVAIVSSKAELYGRLVGKQLRREKLTVFQQMTAVNSRVESPPHQV